MIPGYHVGTGDWEDFLCGTYDTVEAEEVARFMRSGPGDLQPWTLVPAPRLRRIWDRFSETGFVHDVRGLDRIACTVMDNIVKIRVNTELTGHSAGGFDYGKYGDEHPGLEAKAEGCYHEWCLDPATGMWRISDYQVENLLEDAVRIFAAPSPELKLVAVDIALNRVHARSDLASWFVEGGSGALSGLSGTAAGLQGACAG